VPSGPCPRRDRASSRHAIARNVSAKTCCGSSRTARSRREAKRSSPCSSAARKPASRVPARSGSDDSSISSSDRDVQDTCALRRALSSIRPFRCGWRYLSSCRSYCAQRKQLN
jgi:hypothetical protein